MMNSDTHTTDLLPAYALNILTAPEAVEVAAHLAVCATCWAELRAYQEITDLLATAVPQVTPPTSLKVRLMQAIETPSEEQHTAIVTPNPQSLKTFNWRTWFKKRPLWQPALILALILLLISNLQLRQRLNETSSPANFGTVTLTSSEVNAEATGLIIISADGEHGTLVVQNLPSLPETKAYQLWLIKDGHRTSGGLFNVDEDGYRAYWVHAVEPLDSYQNFGITIEPAEGSPGPTGEKVLGN